MGEEAFGELGGGLDDVLAVVEDEQQAAVRAVRDVLGVVDGGQFDEPHAVGPAAVRLVRLGGLLGEAGLAGAARPEERDEACPREVVADDADVVLAADEGGQPGPQVATPPSGRCGGPGGAGPGVRTRTRSALRTGGPGDGPPADDRRVAGRQGRAAGRAVGVARGRGVGRGRGMGRGLGVARHRGWGVARHRGRAVARGRAVGRGRAVARSRAVGRGRAAGVCEPRRPGRRAGALRGQEFGVQGAQGRSGVRAEPVGQVPAYVVVGGQRLRGAARVAQGPDPQRLERLVQGLPRAQLGQLRQGVLGPAQGQGRGEPAPARLHPYGLPARGLRGRVGQVREGGAAPQGEGLLVQGGRLGRVRCLGAGQGQPLEAVQVDVLALGGQPVAAGGGQHGRVPQRPSQPRHQRLQGGHGVGRRVAVPHLVDQQPGRYHPPRAQRERGQERTQAGSADGHGGPVVAEDLGGAENRVTHRPIVPGPRLGPEQFSVRAPG